MKCDLSRIRKNSETVHDYVTAPSKAKDAFDKRRVEYKLDPAVAKELKNRAKDFSIVAFSAEWCPDCMRNVLILNLISEATGLEVRVFGHMMRDAKSNTKRWAIPPCAPEVEEFNVVKIPLIVVLDKAGEKVGEVVENPPLGKTLEQALLDIIK